MILAAPLVIPFAKAVGLSVGTLGMAALADKVNDYIQDNPEESMEILSTIIPNIGIGQIFMSKEKISLEDLDEMTDEEAQDLTKEEKAELMKQAGKSGGKNKRQTMIDLSEKLGLSGPGREKQDIEYEVDERYDEGGVEDAPKPKFDYKRFFRKADGGAIGVESLFEERKNFRGGGTYQGRGGYGASRRTSTSAKAPPSMGFGNPPPGSGGGGGGGSTTRKTPPITRRGGGGPNLNLTQTTTPNFGIKALEFAKKYNPFNLVFGTPVEAGEFKLDDLISIGAAKPGTFYGYNLTDKGKALEDFRETAKNFKFSKNNPAKTPQAALNLITSDKFQGTYGKSDMVKEKDFIQSAIDKGFLAEEKDYGLQKPLDEYLADGGRVGFNVGGITDPQALAIYNSMNAYGFSDQEIADAITAQGYDAGTLGQTTTPDTPTAPTPGEGIIGIDLQQRDTGGGFNPFGPLQSTFTKDLSEVKGFDFLTPKEQMNKYKAQTQDNMFGLGRFFQPKIRGTLGNRLQKQFQTGQKLPSVFAKVAGAQSPFNIDSKNYNPDFADQLNYLELGDDLIGMSSVGLKYGKGSVLAGKNVISGFGSNNYLTALNKFIRNTKNEERRKQGERERDAFLAAEKARKEKEARDRQDMLEAAIRTRRDSGESLSDIGRDMFTGPGKAFEKRSGGFSVDSSGNRRNYGGR